MQHSKHESLFLDSPSKTVCNLLHLQLNIFNPSQFIQNILLHYVPLAPIQIKQKPPIFLGGSRIHVIKLPVIMPYSFSEQILMAGRDDSSGLFPP